MNGLPLRRAAVAIIAIATCALLVLFGWPEPAPRALVAPNGWSVSGGFTPVTPATSELRTAIRTAPDARFLQSWKPGVGNVAGTVTTAPFTPPPAFVVPYRGFAGEPGVALFLECLRDGARVLVASGRTNTQWSEVLLTADDTGCEGPVRLVAQSTSTTAYLAVGTPFAVDRLALAKRSVFVRIAVLLLAWSALAGLVLAGARLAARRFGPHMGAFAGLIAVGIVCYAQFFVFWWLPGAGSALAGLLLAIGIGTLLRAAWSPATGEAHERALQAAVWTWGLVAVSLLVLVVMVEDGSGAWAVNNRFTPVRWSTDNQIPGLVAEAIASGRHALLGELLPWTLGDRPPLAYGWHASLVGPALQVPALADGHLLAPIHLAAGIALNTLWVVPAGLALQRLLPPGRALPWGVVLLTTTPFLLFNSVYVWPKLAAAAFGFAAAWLLFVDRAAPDRLRDDDRGLVLAAMLSALALLSHGGALFGVLCSLAMTAWLRGLPSWRGTLVAPIVALTLLVPWMLWQSLHGMDANPLAKQLFAGTPGLDRPDAGLLALMRDGYAALSLREWATLKLDAAMSLLFGLRNTCGLHEAGVVHDLVDRIRLWGFFYPLAGIGPLALALLALAVPRRDAGRTAAARLAIFGLLSVALAGLLSWTCHINHHQSYQSMLALALAGAVVVAAGGRGWRVLGLAGVACSAWVWGVEPLRHFVRHDLVAIALGVVLMLVWWGWIARSRRTAGAAS
jgi:hypothetical protein